jgi:hypothetical protein
MSWATEPTDLDRFLVENVGKMYAIGEIRDIPLQTQEVIHHPERSKRLIPRPISLECGRLCPRHRSGPLPSWQCHDTMTNLTLTSNEHSTPFRRQRV